VHEQKQLEDEVENFKTLKKVSKVNKNEKTYSFALLVD
jgi:hypothetical protein